MRFYLPVLLLTPLAAQDPMSNELRASYAGIKTNLIKLAERMPEEHYAFRPMPSMETFARRVAHIANGNYRTCTGLQGTARSLSAETRTTKAALVTALQESFTACDPAFKSLTDASGAQLVDAAFGNPPLPGQMRSRMGTLGGLLRHCFEMYGYMSVYLREKNVVPPSTEP